MPGPIPLNLEETLAFFGQAIDACRRQGLRPTAGNVTLALRELRAPFTSHSVLKRFGLRFADAVFQHEHGRFPERVSVRTPTLEELEEPEESFIERIRSMDGAEKWDYMIDRSSARIAGAEEKTYHTLEVQEDGPIGVLFLGDLHIGSSAANHQKLDMIRRVVRESRLPLYVMQVGDGLDNMTWHPEEMAKMGLTQMEVLSGAVHWYADIHRPRRRGGQGLILGSCSGNHELWTHKKSGLDLLELIFDRAGASFPYNPTELVLDLQVGDINYRNVLRHAVKGNSMWNPAHGVTKWILHGDKHYDADIIAAGHTHRSGWRSLVSHGRMRTGLQLGAYKEAIADDYGREGGFSDENLHPEMLVVFHPDRKEHASFPFYWQGLPYLREQVKEWRSRKRSSKHSAKAG